MTGRAAGPVDTVIKLGGSVLRDPSGLASAVEIVNALPRDAGLLIVPGGGPFADAVRDADRALRFGDEAAHWMAILAMDQVAHILADRLDRATLVETADAIDRAGMHGRPVLAPYRLLRAADALPGALPHTWDVTSDSIAAWFAGRLGARRLILVKAIAPSAGGLRSLVDPYFGIALPTGVTGSAVTLDQLADAVRRDDAGAPAVARGPAHPHDVRLEGSGTR